MVYQLSCRQKSKFGLFSIPFAARFVDAVFSPDVFVFGMKEQEKPLDLLTQETTPFKGKIIVVIGLHFACRYPDVCGTVGNV